MGKQVHIELLSPRKLCKKQALIKGQLAVSEFARFSRIGDGDKSVEFSLNFDRDDQGRAKVSGYVRSSRTLLCQRCLKEREREIEIPIELVLVASEEEASELENMDSVVLEGDNISLVELIEDDLLLGVPDQVCPNPGACENEPQFNFAEHELEEEHNNPFEILASLKMGKD